MGLFNLFKKKPENSEAARVRQLLENGRITEGIIVDSETSDGGDEIVFYVYTIQGVDFESSEILTEDKLQNPLKYAPGAKVGVRFDPKNHGNSMLV
jgi:hypothetical protein